jgi:hypothetical protein
MMKKIMSIMSIIMLGAFLAACSPPIVKKSPCFAKNKKQLAADISAFHGTVVHIGDKTIYALALQNVFVGRSKNLRRPAKRLLARISKTMHCGHHWRATVQVFSGPFSSKRASRALARQQGVAVLSFLRAHGAVQVMAVRTHVHCVVCDKMLNRVEIITAR